MGLSSNAGPRPAVARVRTAVPHLSAVYLPRRRLRDHLDETGDGEVVLVSAPAGYGKTLLLADWVTRHAGRVAWLTLDREDNTDRRFWAGVLAALSTVAAVPAANPLRTMGLPEVPSRSPEFLDAVIDALVAVPGPLVIVFDDLQELIHPDPVAGLATLLENRPPGLRLVLASRSDPPLHLGRLRLTGELRELRAPALAFTSDEAAAVLARADVHVTPAQHRLLHAQTAGWPAALRLASISLRDAADPAAFLSDLTGNGQAISDYLVGEILSSLPDEVVEVLFAVSVCDAVTAPLAATLAERSDAGDALADLEHDTSLVVSYGKGRRWFRVHPLLRAQLYADLRRRRPDRIADLHRRALAWFAATRNPVGALRHATLADEPHLVRDALRKHGAVLATSGHHAEVGAALERLDSAGLLRDDVRLLLVGALAHMERGQVDAADVLLERADARRPTEPDAALRALRSLTTARRAWYSPDSPRPDGGSPSAVETELARGEHAAAGQPGHGRRAGPGRRGGHPRRGGAGVRGRARVPAGPGARDPGHGRRAARRDHPHARARRAGGPHRARRGLVAHGGRGVLRGHVRVRHPPAGPVGDRAGVHDRPPGRHRADPRAGPAGRQPAAARHRRGARRRPVRPRRAPGRPRRDARGPGRARRRGHARAADGRVPGRRRARRGAALRPRRPRPGRLRVGGGTGR